MGEGLFLFDIIIFGMIAAFLVFRLRGVLGRRTGHQGERRNPYAEKPSTQHSETSADKGLDGRAGRDNVVRLPERRPGMDSVDVASQQAAGGLTQIKIADPSFDEAEFVNGAEMAFGMIVDAYANGDTAGLRPLLADDLYDDFANAIRTRLANEQTLETRIEMMKSVEIADARLDGRTALVTIRYVTDQINVTRDQDGNVVDGDPATPTEVIDLWTYARNTNSDDPNWLLVQTDAPETDVTEGDAPETDTPETDAPETGAAESDASGTDAGGTVGSDDTDTSGDKATRG